MPKKLWPAGDCWHLKVSTLKVKWGPHTSSHKCMVFSISSITLCVWHQRVKHKIFSWKCVYPQRWYVWLLGSILHNIILAVKKKKCCSNYFQLTFSHCCPFTNDITLQRLIPALTDLTLLYQFPSKCQLKPSFNC